jgi:hypothetical protein
VLEVDYTVLRGQGWQVTCLWLTTPCSGSVMRWRRASTLGLRWQCDPRPRTRWWRASGPGSRTAGGGGRTVVSRVTKGRALGGFKKLLSATRERARWPKILGHGHSMQDASSLPVFPFS